MLALAVSGCAVQPTEPLPGDQPAAEAAATPEAGVPEPAAATAAEASTERLLELIVRVIESTTADQRRSIEKKETTRFQQAPSYQHLLRLTLVRAFSAALPAELKETRSDLQALANGRQELSNSERYVALLALLMVDQRLQMGTQIADLQRQIDSLTEIEASLKDNDVDTAPEVSP